MLALLTPLNVGVLRALAVSEMIALPVLEGHGVGNSDAGTVPKMEPLTVTLSVPLTEEHMD